MTEINDMTDFELLENKANEAAERLDELGERVAKLENGWVRPLKDKCISDLCDDLMPSPSWYRAIEKRVEKLENLVLGLDSSLIRRMGEQLAEVIEDRDRWKEHAVALSESLSRSMRALERAQGSPDSASRK